MHHLFTRKVLQKHTADYSHCKQCGLIQATTPDWLEEAYSNAITSHDIGLLSRNIKFSKELTPLLYNTFGLEGTYLDTAGGYGVFTRLMRDIGFNFQHTDKYCENLFAKNFEATQSHYSAITAFEVMEHVIDPIEFIKADILPYTPKFFIFSTLTYSGPPPTDDWWYYAFETGQHISFYTRETLEKLANTVGYSYHPLKGQLHLFIANGHPTTNVNRTASTGLFNLNERSARKKMKKTKLKKKDSEFVKKIK
jgi:hypothetical protein